MTENYEIDIEYVEWQFVTELEGLTLNVTERDIGNGPEYALEAHSTDTGKQLSMSQWYSKEEFEAFTSGMKKLSVFFNQAENVREE